jgi:hypothetical protein
VEDQDSEPVGGSHELSLRRDSDFRFDVGDARSEPGVVLGPRDASHKKDDRLNGGPGSETDSRGARSERCGGGHMIVGALFSVEAGIAALYRSYWRLWQTVFVVGPYPSTRVLGFINDGLKQNGACRFFPSRDALNNERTDDSIACP